MLSGGSGNDILKGGGGSDTLLGWNRRRHFRARLRRVRLIDQILDFHTFNYQKSQRRAYNTDRLDLSGIFDSQTAIDGISAAAALSNHYIYFIDNAAGTGTTVMIDFNGDNADAVNDLRRRLPRRRHAKPARRQPLHRVRRRSRPTALNRATPPLRAAGSLPLRRRRHSARHAIGERIIRPAMAMCSRGNNAPVHPGLSLRSWTDRISAAAGTTGSQETDHGKQIRK